jgi:hypothetical protein
MMDPFANLAVIIPVAPHEAEGQQLLEALSTLPDSAEILLAGPQRPEWISRLSTTLQQRMRWIDSPMDRGIQLNRGAQATQKAFLWFLHADSRLGPHALTRLRMALHKKPDALHFFNLRFLQDGPRWMVANTIGCWVRSRIFRVPFGDQGLCVSRESFNQLGGFPEDAPYGEDHLFVWRAHRAGIPLRCVGSTIETSARKYQQQGWLKTTRRHVVYWTQQAFPEWIKVLRGA